MNNGKILNFFTENEKFYKKQIDRPKLIIISIIAFSMVVNINKFYRVQNLEENVVEMKLDLNSMERNKENSNINEIMSKLSTTLNLMNNNELKSVEIKGKKLKIKGATNNIEIIENYLNILKEIENTKEASIDLINNSENLYEFEISSFFRS